jgi:hypothetical protein
MSVDNFISAVSQVLGGLTLAICGAWVVFS